MGSKRGQHFQGDQEEQPTALLWERLCCLHCEFPIGSEHNGREFIYRFDNGFIHSSRYGSCRLKADLVSVVPLGHGGHQDMLNQKNETLGCMNLMARFSPGLQFNTKEGEFLAWLCAMFFAIDDLVDSYAFEGNIHGKGYASLASKFQTLANCVLGLVKKEEAVGSEDKFIRNFGLAFIQLTEISSTFGDNKFYINDMADYLRYCGLESSTCVGELNLSPLQRIRIRRKTIGVYPTLEAIFLAKQLIIPDDLRGSPLFQILTGLLVDHVLLVNDLISLKKELSANEIASTILARVENGETLQEAFDSTLQEINSIAKSFVRARNKLTQIYSGMKDLDAILEICSPFLYGNIEYMCDSPRYYSTSCNFYLGIKPNSLI